ncbi:MAG TPA: V-type ATP synthase subunit B [Solirubrobacteraceae bacterium]|nr:V-type ATP synthase subunit B [Solirubrobacteraceae bacterium]
MSAHRARIEHQAPIEYRSIGSIRGPLIVVQDVSGVGWDEVANVTLETGEVRHGTVLDVDRDLAVVEVLEGTAGMRLDSARVAFTGTPMQIRVSEEWLGRTCNGRGEPIDGGPPVLAGALRPVEGSPINPAAREAPREAILTGVTAIDGLATLVRGQKLPVFSVGGLPHLELAAQVAAQAHVKDEPFAIVFAALGLPHADVQAVRSVLERRAELGDLALFVNTADDPVVERIVTPRVALTVAEHLAFDLGRHVLVVLADLTNYCEAVRQVSAARGEIPSRRGYPGYLYSDLASLLERAGRIKGVGGSLTQVPVLTMPAGDITHPVPDVTGYITEGQIVLSPEAFARGVSPPFDPLASLSRLMRHGAGPALTRADHLEIAAQMYGIAARGRQTADLAEVVGEDALSDVDREYLGVLAAFESEFLSQPLQENRTLEQTLDRAWAVASMLPRSELSMIAPSTIDDYYQAGRRGGGAADPAG